MDVVTHNCGETCALLLSSKNEQSRSYLNNYDECSGCYSHGNQRDSDTHITNDLEFNIIGEIERMHAVLSKIAMSEF